ncbi:hypothetical protein [Paenibacillus sp. HGF5]|nr:hypothetical protein [Paenibacillus sp. HGF5]
MSAELSECVSIVESVQEADLEVRKALAGGFRKIKGRTTGRLIGERFSEYFPREFLENTLDLVISLAGYNTNESDVDTNDEMS